jgi:hypothetical protein
MMGGMRATAIPVSRASIQRIACHHLLPHHHGRWEDIHSGNEIFDSKTDGSEKVPQKGAPALVNAGMLGDRADAIFAAPEEISGFIKREC